MVFLWTARGELRGKDGWWKSLFRGAEIMQDFQLFFAGPWMHLGRVEETGKALGSMHP
jgi:hypothetical protein